MPVGWFLMPYRPLDLGDGTFARSLAVNLDATVLAQFQAEEPRGARLREVLVLGNNAVCKVRASKATLQAIAALPGTDRLPVDLLDEPLRHLTPAQKTGLQNRILGLGYTGAELQSALGPDIGSRTLREVVRFIARRARRQFTTDGVTIVEAGPVDLQRSDVLIDRLDGAVTE